MIRHSHSRPSLHNGGFTTVELAIVLIIFGLVFSVVMMGYTLYSKQQTLEATAEALGAAQDALAEFQGTLGVYPCPANPSLGPGQANYGREQRATALLPNHPDYRNAPCAASFPTAGADTLADADFAANDPIWIGAIPFNTLLDPDGNPQTRDGVIDADISDRLARDAWANKIDYAVTGALTQISTYNDFFGAINVVDENDQSVVSENEDQNNDGVLGPGEDINGNGILDMGRYAHFVLVSHGANARGAYTRNGPQVEGCPPAVAFPPPLAPLVQSPRNERDNCDNDGTFLQGLHTEREDSLNDDIVRYRINQGGRLWMQVSETQIVNVNPSGAVGIGTTDPIESLDINGDLATSLTRANRVCDSAGNCLLPSALGGTAIARGAGTTPSEMMQCPPGQVVRSIENNQVNCVSPFAGTPPTTCPVGPPQLYAKGFNSLTGVICCNPAISTAAGGC